MVCVIRRRETASFPCRIWSSVSFFVCFFFSRLDYLDISRVKTTSDPSMLPVLRPTEKSTATAWYHPNTASAATTGGRQLAVLRHSNRLEEITLSVPTTTTATTRASCNNWEDKEEAEKVVVIKIVVVVPAVFLAASMRSAPARNESVSADC